MFPPFQFLSILLCFPFYPLLAISLPFQNSSSHLCHYADKMALLQFKNGFTIRPHFSDMYDDVPFFASYPKTTSWKETRDCCLWDGVTCDSISGHVIGLDLNCSQLGGIIHHNSTLFHLSQLRSINLAYNNFHPSRISRNFGHFSNLEVLNLSHAGFSGVIPNHFSLLSRLVSLDLTSPVIFYDGSESDPFFIQQLPYTFVRLEIPHVDRIIRNLTHLRQLHLNGVLINSALPQTLANLSSLSSLQLSYCNLQGVFHSNILTLPHLRSLIVASNPNLYLDASNFNNLSTSLEVINFSNTNLSGVLPKYTHESQPSRLRQFVAFSCNISGTIPLWIWNTTEVVSLGGNQFMGELPSAVNINELTQFNSLDLSDNLLEGPLPHWLWNLPSVHDLDLSANQFNGKFYELSPKSNFVNSSQNICYLDLSNNRIQGEIPNWFFSMGKDSLWYVNVSHNNLTGGLDLHSWEVLEALDVHSNSFQGLLPCPPPMIGSFFASNNKFHGDITCSSFCELTMFRHFDLSKNYLSGKIPQCFGYLSGFLELLDLGSNKFHGIIPITFTKGCNLKSIHLNNNQFEGKIPRSLKRCQNLQVLDLGKNRFNDSFPHWLDNLRELKVLVLQSNNFQGLIKDELKANKHPFPKLQILDLSRNQFCGKLPARYIQNFKALMVDNNGGHTKGRKYIGDYDNYQDTLVLTMKGMPLRYKILTILTTLDFSSNRFNGEIPTSVGELVALVALNISHNQLAGHIPPSLANLAPSLESLDLSCNKLEGEIPQQLVKLTFLAYFDVSKNLLRGPIPQSTQFNTFPSRSFEGNSGLCGRPLQKCRKEDVHDHQPATPASEQEGNDIIDIITSISLWEIILIGFGLGATLGLVVGYYMLSSERPNWFSRKADKFEYVMVQRSKKLSKRRQRRT